MKQLNNTHADKRQLGQRIATAALWRVARRSISANLLAAAAAYAAARPLLLLVACQAKYMCSTLVAAGQAWSGRMQMVNKGRKRVTVVGSSSST